mmetsp:Transcript_21430/g.47791  ORF Transcript_21430/g.47791 Transcript_21430/m.47791 type:complete len:238 (-) Transcript_21430:1672-2385(-)
MVSHAADHAAGEAVLRLAPRGTREQPGGLAEEHRGALRPVQRHVPAVPEQGHDLLRGHLRQGGRGSAEDGRLGGGRLPGGVPAQEDRPDAGPHRAAGRRHRPGDRLRLGQHGHPRGAALPRAQELDGDHHLAAAAGAGAGAHQRGRRGRQGQGRLLRLPRGGRALRRRLLLEGGEHRDDRGRRPRVPARLLRGHRRVPEAGWPRLDPGDLRARRPVRDVPEGHRLHPRAHLPRVEPR